MPRTNKDDRGSLFNKCSSLYNLNKTVDCSSQHKQPQSSSSSVIGKAYSIKHNTTSRRDVLKKIHKMSEEFSKHDEYTIELCKNIAMILKADAFRILKIENKVISNSKIYSYNMKRRDTVTPIWGNGIQKVYKFILSTRECVRLNSNVWDKRFQNVFKTRLNGAAHAMWHVLLNEDGNISGIFEIWRTNKDGYFQIKDEETAFYYLTCGGIAHCQTKLLADSLRQKNLNEFLITVVKSVFQDMVSMKILVKKIINFAQRLVDADRASLFLVDQQTNELYATIFDSNVDDISPDAPLTAMVNIEDEFGAQNIDEEIRFPLGTGIAGYVALTGEVLNIVNAYNDRRFNKSVDQRTGYKTETILCMPICTRGATIGVVQMINKREGFFSKDDEEAFSVFSVYCGLALHHAKLYERIKRSEQKYKIALEVLSYHSGCSEEEVSAHRNIIPTAESIHIDSYYFNSMHCDDFQKVSYTISMFQDMFGADTLDCESLLRFVLTVRKNYRNLPYHNWTHGFSVAHCMYSIIKSTKNIFTKNESTALFISALCHDLDHRGKNNKFMMETESPLAAMYSTSTMEHHHFNQTVIIIQQLAQKGHNIFNQLSSTEYKEMLVFVKHCILATDLARFFPNRSLMEELIQGKSFSLEIQNHRMLLMAIAMTACDLCASAKPWAVQVETVRVIFEEFYQQGDAERSAGRVPASMMDRQQPGQQATCQVGFLTGICIPCYTILSNVMIETSPLLDMCKSNLARWRDIESTVQNETTVGAAAVPRD